MNALIAKPTFGINNFYRRQTPDSKYSYFSGSEEQLLQAVEQNFPLRRGGRKAGTFLVPIPVKMGDDYCFTAIVLVSSHSFLNAECVAKSKNETPLICPSVIGRKQPASWAEVLVFPSKMLKEMGETTTGKDYDIVSLHASDVKDQPDHPYELARRVLDSGEQIDAESFSRSIIYWATHAFVKTRFVRHANKKVADLLRIGEMEKAIAVRQKQVPEESPAEAKAYVAALHTFMIETDTLYC